MANPYGYPGRVPTPASDTIGRKATKPRPTRPIVKKNHPDIFFRPDGAGSRCRVIVSADRDEWIDLAREL